MTRASEGFTYEEVVSVISYDRQTGEMRWMPRPRESFSYLREFVRWNNRYAGKPALNYIRDGYRVGTLQGRSVKAHRIAWLLHYREWPEGQIDHINGRRDDNRIQNLRLVDSLGNNRNRKPPVTNTSGVVGVYQNRYNKNTWEARVRVNGKQVTIGWFSNKSDAAAARKSAEARLGYHENHGRAADDAL